MKRKVMLKIKVFSNTYLLSK